MTYFLKNTRFLPSFFQRNFLSNQLEGGSVGDFCAFVRISRDEALRVVPPTMVGKHLLAQWNALDDSIRQHFHLQVRVRVES